MRFKLLYWITTPILCGLVYKYAWAQAPRADNVGGWLELIKDPDNLRFIAGFLACIPVMFMLQRSGFAPVPDTKQTAKLREMLEKSHSEVAELSKQIAVAEAVKKALKEQAQKWEMKHLRALREDKKNDE